MRVFPRLFYPIPTLQHIPKQSLGLTVTDPLHIYRNLVATGVLTPDPKQHRAAIVVQGVYERLLDYKPERYSDLKQRLDAVTASLRALEAAQKAAAARGDTGKDRLRKKTWRDSTFLPTSWQSPQAQSKALIQILSKDEDLLNIQSPRGLLLSGNVGCGKSMLADLLASSLPFATKQRVHFDTFMLSVYAKLEDHRRQSNMQDTYSILHVARELASTSTVLFLDEFQLPDKAAGKILKSLFCNFFMLGGVLIATSNRLPETLVAAEWRKEEFGMFEEVLKSRCEIWDMNSNIDWRRRGEEGRIVALPLENKVTKVVTVPKFYYLNTGDLEEAWDEAVKNAAGGTEAAWEAKSLVVYGREILLRRTKSNAVFFTFDELCVKLLGPADYITIASNFSTIIVDEVPVLTSKPHRHEARRFITLLDAIYECHCKLLLRAEVPIEDLFFPDAIEKPASEYEDSLHSETFAEAHQDLTVPFRPNVSLYEQVLENPDDPLTWKRKKYAVADQDSDFTGQVDFRTVGKYTGEDEKFSFKRAVSRVWEVCGDKWWKSMDQPSNSHTTRKISHKPLPKSLRRWEGRISAGKSENDPNATLLENSASPRPGAPRFMPVHIWGVIDNWGKRSGRWGRGVNVYKEDDTRDKDSAPKSEK
ncbi:hypothetical protein H072_1158 [Dactylellina haptotyla CBS 200.50]|uniref:AAA+ ATPase domain-containing protein n=1 Tax=Dactylellina haptotyla (strain CBS 200.50) TaxID=1284197 RepID=S8API2_DACHA|nr:hypothetical protein H072_1158 [Dactylellina haptotyla CBS 200.50]